MDFVHQVTLPADPTVALHAVTKQYVDVTRNLVETWRYPTDTTKVDAAKVGGVLSTANLPAGSGVTTLATNQYTETANGINYPLGVSLMNVSTGWTISGSAGLVRTSYVNANRCTQEFFSVNGDTWKRGYSASAWSAWRKTMTDVDSVALDARYSRTLSSLVRSTAVTGSSASTANVDIPELVTSTFVANGQPLLIRASCQLSSTVAGDEGRLILATTAGATIATATVYLPSAGVGYRAHISTMLPTPPSNGTSVSYKLQLVRRSGTGTVTAQVSATDPATLLVQTVPTS